MFQMTKALTAAGMAGLLLTAASAHAAIVTYVPTGVFGSGTLAGTAGYVNGADSIVFSDTAGAAVSTPSFVSFGTFTTSSTTATTGGTVTSPFTLTISQSAPTSGSGTFSASLAGTLTVSSSTAYLQFASPLSITIGSVVYGITAADGGIAGRLNLAPPSSGGTVNLPGFISEVPEPASLGLAAIAAAGLMRRRNRTA